MEYVRNMYFIYGSDSKFIVSTNYFFQKKMRRCIVIAIFLKGYAEGPCEMEKGNGRTEEIAGSTRAGRQQQVRLAAWDGRCVR